MIEVMSSDESDDDVEDDLNREPSVSRQPLLSLKLPLQASSNALYAPAQSHMAASTRTWTADVKILSRRNPRARRGRIFLLAPRPPLTRHPPKNA